MKFLLMKRTQLINKYIEEKGTGRLTEDQVKDYKRHLKRIEEMIRNKRG